MKMLIKKVFYEATKNPPALDIPQQDQPRSIYRTQPGLQPQRIP